MLLRTAVGVAALIQGTACLTGSGYSAPAALAEGLVAMVSGGALLAGFMTPVAGGVVTLGEVGLALSWIPLVSNPFDAKLVTLFVAAVSASIILLGPGALSLDARLFGRREIIIPRSSQRP